MLNPDPDTKTQGIDLPFPGYGKQGLYLLVAERIVDASSGSHHARLGGQPLALQLSWVGGNDPL